MTRAGSGSLPRYIVQRILLVIPMIWSSSDAGLLHPLRSLPGTRCRRRSAGSCQPAALDQRRHALGLDRAADRAVLGLPHVGPPPRLRDHLHRQPAGPRRDPRQRRCDAHAHGGGLHRRAGGRHPARAARGPLPRLGRPTSGSGCSASSPTRRRCSSSGFLMQLLRWPSHWACPRPARPPDHRVRGPDQDPHPAGRRLPERQRRAIKDVLST